MTAGGPERRRAVLGTVLALVGLPVLLVPIEAALFHARNRGNGSIVSSGQAREYLLHVPDRYDPATPTPLVVSLHGGALWGAAQRDISRWNEVADREGLIVVYPTGTDVGGVRGWHVGEDPGLATDVRFIADLIDTLQAAYHIDPARVYADGLSNGGGMAFVLSCTLAHRIAAVGMVAAALTVPWEWCPDRRPVPLIAFHGTADRIVPYEGGSTWVSPGTFPNVPAWAARWARRNRCAPTPADSAVAPDVTRRAYTACADDAAVMLYTVVEGGHTWPGGGPVPEWFAGPTSTSVDATERIWAFFREHPLR